MASKSSDLRSELSKAKGLGAAHHGVSHWWWQRVTAVALIPLSAWFVYQLVGVMIAGSSDMISEWFMSPINACLMVALIIAMFYHASLGLQVVIEDYIKSPFAKYGLLLANTFISFGFAVISILAVLRLHFIM